MVTRSQIQSTQSEEIVGLILVLMIKMDSDDFDTQFIMKKEKKLTNWDNILSFSHFITLFFVYFTFIQLVVDLTVG